MATYIVLGQFTDQGIRNVKETTRRAEALKELAKKVGATVAKGSWKPRTQEALAASVDVFIQ